MIWFDNIQAGYGTKIILKNISGVFEDGKIHAVIGKNGCGKSTLLKCLAGSLSLKSGMVKADRLNFEALSVKDRAKIISYMPQFRNVPDMDVMRFALHGRFAYLSYPRRYGKLDIQKTKDVLEHLDLLNLRNENLKNLSGGQRQKAYLALVLIQNTQNMLFDEPMTYLDAGQQYEILKELDIQKKAGKCIVVVWHDLIQALEFADTITLMDQGKILFHGSSQECLEQKIIENNFNVKIEKFCKGNKIYYALDKKE